VYCCAHRDAVGSDVVLSSDEESEAVTMTTGSTQHDRLTVAGSAIYGKDKCRKSLKLTSDQLVS